MDHLLSKSNVFLSSAQGYEISETFTKYGEKGYNMDIDQEKIEINFRCHGMHNFPNGDNRWFEIKGPHRFDRVKYILKEKYNYLDKLWIQYEDSKMDVITVSTDDDYQIVLKDSAIKTGSMQHVNVDLVIGQWSNITGGSNNRNGGRGMGNNPGNYNPPSNFTRQNYNSNSFFPNGG